MKLDFTPNLQYGLPEVVGMDSYSTKENEEATLLVKLGVVFRCARWWADKNLKGLSTCLSGHNWAVDHPTAEQKILGSTCFCSKILVECSILCMKKCFATNKITSCSTFSSNRFQMFYIVTFQGWEDKGVCVQSIWHPVPPQIPK